MDPPAATAAEKAGAAKRKRADAVDVSAMYRKLDHREHVLLRPGMYVGSVDVDSTHSWVFDGATRRMVFRQIQYVPALYKIFDEVLMNAVDHATRLKRAQGEGRAVGGLVRNIRVDIDRASGSIKVVNDGDGIDVDLHSEHGCYIPELIFGHLLTSANYDDAADAERTIGGQNGIGAKACNIFSSAFVVETVDATRRKLYTQRFCDNMRTIGRPEIKACAKKPYTSVTFTPDYARFGMPEGLTDDMYDLIVKRVYDATAVTDADVAVHLNGTKLECKSFERYVDLYIGDRGNSVRVYEKLSDRFELVVACSPEGMGTQHVSFVNGVWTMRGGKHVDYVVGVLARKLSDLIQERKKGAQVKPQYVRDSLFVFIKSTIPNPAFDSQSKETLTTPSSKFGCRMDVGDKFIEKLYKLELVERALALSQATSSKQLKKTDGRKSVTITGIPKLDDANWAGTAKSQQCTLILTEGDSAKSMAISGMDQVGRDRFGVYPLRGKVLNVCEASTQKLADNKEISDLKKILGLEAEKTYASTADLRYGRIMALTDADSVTGDTPLLLRDPASGVVDVRAIDDLPRDQDWARPGGKDNESESCGHAKEYSTTRYEVWTERGWTRIKHVMRHRTSKRVFRVLTHTGCVDVTEDHSLLDAHANEVAPGQCVVGQELLHSFPRFQEHMPPVPHNLEALPLLEVQGIASRLHIQCYRRYQITRKAELAGLIRAASSEPGLSLVADGVSVEEAWLMGLFWADGGCDGGEWVIASACAAYLERAGHVLRSVHRDLGLAFEIVARGPAGHVLVLTPGGGTDGMVRRYRDLFYTSSGLKRVPALLLNASAAVRRAFFDGCCAGLPPHRRALCLEVGGKVGALGMFFLCRSLGFAASVDVGRGVGRESASESEVYRICLTPPGGVNANASAALADADANANVVREVVDLGATERYVYDLETKNHHFHAGVGQMIVHNTDGSHIKGLIMNLFHQLWPSLLKVDGFLTSMLTPIVKAKKGGKGGAKEVVVEFFNLADFVRWREEHAAERGWDVKYYKGLGTSTAKEAKEYFKKMRMVVYRHDGAASDDVLDLAFNKKRADDRKAWLMKYDTTATLDYGNTDVSYHEFIHKDLVHFSNYDVVRSIPSVVDGLKVSQRKVLFAVMKKGITAHEVRVASLSGIVQAEAAYHHGDASLNGTIVGMAQDFVGSNNVNLLVPNGQFGTRIQGGKDSASPRYIHTLLSPVAARIFIKLDNPVLKYLEDDGQQVEPEHYLPIIPMVLVNGTIGIGTGFSTNVPCFNPIEIIRAVRARLDQGHASVSQVTPTPTPIAPEVPVDVPAPEVSVEEVPAPEVPAETLHPWYRGFTGKITQRDGGRYTSWGCYTRTTPTSVEVTELPIGTWTEDFKELLDTLQIAGAEVKRVDSKYGDETVRFTVHFTSKDALDAWLAPLTPASPTARNRLEKEFGLGSTKYLGTANMYLFDANGRIKKYHSVSDILTDFCVARMAGYVERKRQILAENARAIRVLDGKVRFLGEVADGQVRVTSMSKAALEDTLREREYPAVDDAFEYLTRMPIYSLTEDKKRGLEEELAALTAADAEFAAKAPSDLWKSDLDALLAVLSTGSPP